MNSALRIPQNISSLVIYYNKNLFDQAGLPYPADDWTWEAFLATAQALTTDSDGDGKTDQFGAGIEPSLIRLAPFIWQSDGEIVNDPITPTRLGLLAIALAGVFASGIPFREMRRAWLFIGGFIVFFSFMTFLTGRGGVEAYQQEHLIRRFAAPFIILGWQPALDITIERAFYALSQLVRVFSLASMTILIPYSLNPAHYGIAFRGLGLPDKFAYAMDLTMRFIPTFARDFQLTMDAQRARGYEIEKLSGGLVAQVRKLAPLIVPVTIHAIIGSEDIIDAMDLRAFGVGPRTWLEELRYRRRDRALIAFGVALLLASLILTVLGFGGFWVPEALLRLVGG